MRVDHSDLDPAEEAAGPTQHHHQSVLLAGTLRAQVEDKQGEHEEAQAVQQARAPCRHHQVARVGGCKDDVRVVRGGGMTGLPNMSRMVARMKMM